MHREGVLDPGSRHSLDNAFALILEFLIPRAVINELFMFIKNPADDIPSELPQ